MSPQRTCIGCRAVLRPDQGLRITVAADGSLVVSRAAPGRGAWLCRSSAGQCAEVATRRRAWGRALRRDVSPQAVEDLRSRLGALAATVGEGPPER